MGGDTKMTALPSVGAIAQAYWELSNKTFDTTDDEWVFPVLRLISDRAAEIDVERPAQLGGGVVSDAELLEWFDTNPRAVWRSSGYREHSDAWSYKNVHGVTKDTGSLRDAIIQARYSALGKGGR